MVDVRPARRGTFLPDDGQESLTELAEIVWRKRFSTFAALSQEIVAAVPEIAEDTGFASHAVGVLSDDQAKRRALVSDPAFGAWVNLAIVAANKLLLDPSEGRNEIEGLLRDFAKLLQRISEHEDGAGRTIPGTDVLVERFDIDPLIARVTPPSYTFTQDEEEQRRLVQSGFSTAFFRDVAGFALRRIGAAWPECYQYVTRLVRIVGYLPDADFRSCSASRYMGVIYIAARDSSILDLEESIVHEGGHQLLYTVVDMSPIVREDAEGGDFTLPWSGQIRDFYGYFHAFYIYILLATYMHRVATSTGKLHTEVDRSRARDRMTFIVRGLQRAVEDFRDNSRLTPFGRSLVDSLEGEVDRLMSAEGVPAGS
jgi:hypothetical protein